MVVSVKNPDTGELKSKEILLGELEMIGGVTLTLGRNCTVPLELDISLTRKASDIRSTERAVRHDCMKRRMKSFTWWKGAKRRRLANAWRQKIAVSKLTRLGDRALSSGVNSALAVHQIR